jgi:hypothetical protein
MDEAGVPDVTVPGDATEERIDEFKHFLDEVDPDDFRG